MTIPDKETLKPLLDRLQEMGDRVLRHNYSIGHYWNVVDEAYDEISRLEQDFKRKTEALVVANKKLERILENEQMTATDLSIYYMHDNHCFTKLKGNSIEDVLKEADRIENDSPFGALCPVTVLCGKKELRRVGPMVHSHGESKIAWEEGKKLWREEIMRDLEIMSLFEFEEAL